MKRKNGKKERKLEMISEEEVIPAATEPFIWQVELTNRCLYQCLGCPRQFMSRPLGNMDFHTFRACIGAIKHIQKQNRPMGLHHFGESLLHPEISRFVSYALKNNVPTWLSCNPDMLSLDLSRSLISAGLTRVTFSLDGLDQAVLQKIRGSGSDYLKAEKGILDFMKAKVLEDSDCEIRIQMIAYTHNSHQWEKFIEKWEQYDVFAYIKRFDAWTTPKLSTLGVRSMNAVCTFPYNSVVVLWDGRVVPCCHDYDGELVMGYIQDGLKHVWKNQKYQQFREDFHHKSLLKNHLCLRCSWWNKDS